MRVIKRSNSLGAKKRLARLRRARRLRAEIRHHTHPRPRLSVDRSLAHITAQIFTNDGSQVLVSASTREKALREQLKSTGNVAAAKLIGETVAKRAKEKGLTKVTFDRSGYKYHGRIKALADGARESGMEF